MRLPGQVTIRFTRSSILQQPRLIALTVPSRACGRTHGRMLNWQSAGRIFVREQGLYP